MSTALYSGVSGLALGTGLYKNVSGLWGGAAGLIDGFGGGSPFGGASLYLNFLAGAPLDSRVTFSRGSNATLVDSTGKITYAPANLVFNSADVSNASWNKLVSGTAASATTFNFTSAFGSGFENQTAVTLSAGTNVIASFFASGSGTIQIGIVDASGAFGSTYTTVVLTSTLTRYSVSRTLVDANALLRVRNTSGVAVTGATCTQMQLEPVTYQTTPSTYVATTTAAYYGPRFDYDPVTLAAKGLLIEEQRTNVVTYSEQLDNVAWTKTAVTVTANATTSPDGTVNADAIYQTAVSSLQSVNSDVFVATSGVTYTLSVYLKAGTSRFVQVTFPSTAMGATQYANIDLTDVTVTASAASTVSVNSVGNGWVRVNYTVAAVASSNLNPFIIAINSGTAARGATITGNVANFFYVYGVQVEAGAFATSYIPTVASTVTRSADVATMTGTNFSSWYNQSEGTLACEFIPTTLNASGLTTYTATGISDGTSNNYNVLYVYSNFAGGAIRTGAVNQADLNAGGSPANNTPIKSIIAYATNDIAVTANGTVVKTDTSATIGTTMTNLGIGNRALGNPINGHIRQIAYYNTRLPNATLQQLTAPSLAITLNLDFINGTYDA